MEIYTNKMHLDPADNALLTQHTSEKNQELKTFYEELNKECTESEIIKDSDLNPEVKISHDNIKTFFHKWVCNYNKHYDGDGFIHANKDFKKSCRYLKYWFYDQIVTNKLNSDKIHEIFKDWNTPYNVIEFFINDFKEKVSNPYPSLDLALHPDTPLASYPSLGPYSSLPLDTYSEPYSDHGLFVDLGQPYPFYRDNPYYYDGAYAGLQGYAFPFSFSTYGHYNGGFSCIINISNLEEIMNEKLFLDYIEYCNNGEVATNISNVFCKYPYIKKLNTYSDICNKRNMQLETEKPDYCKQLKEIMDEYDVQPVTKFQCSEESVPSALPGQESVISHSAREAPLGSLSPSGDGDNNLQAAKGSSPSGKFNVHNAVTVPASFIGILGIFLSLYKLTPFGPLLRKIILKENTILNNLDEGANNEFLGILPESDNLNLNGTSHYILYNPS
ncbi:PIR Superfamily Protein [Plasmodium ovale curtisi]|uniref:PIR Superfamily Protein n=1 Tax=Plasmodium ovale curtisi TaxID=864141 RepID=A0A1A8XDV8_PLAOA|nr:PIR Superfamily Protein [Plasmodium ovale curtisi]